jgi:hypothetical protein
MRVGVNELRIELNCEIDIGGVKTSGLSTSDLVA